MARPPSACSSRPQWGLALVVVVALTCAASGANEAGIKTLIGQLRSDTSAVRRQAAEALGEMGPTAKPAIAALGQALRDTDREVRLAAAFALAKIGPAAIDTLSRALRAKGMDRYGPRVALNQIGPVAVPAFIEALSDSDADVRACAAWGLCHFGRAARPAAEWQPMPRRDRHCRPRPSRCRPCPHRSSGRRT